MRTLNKKQKKILDRWLNGNYKGIYIDADNLPGAVYDALVKINDHETLYVNINRYICDKVLEKMYG